MKDNIQNKILEWFKKKKIKKKIYKNFLEDNTLESFDLIDLISYIEKEFKIRFSPEDYQDPKFATINNIVKLIKKYSE